MLEAWKGGTWAPPARVVRLALPLLAVLLLGVPFAALPAGAPVHAAPPTVAAGSLPSGSGAGPSPSLPPLAPSGNYSTSAVYLLNTSVVGAAPTNVSYDPANGLLYVTNFGPPIGTTGNSVSILSDTNNTVIATIGVGDDPLASTYDPADGYVYVEDFGTTQNLTVINGTRTIASVRVGSGPTMAAYDPQSGNLYVPNTNSGNVSIVNGTKVVATINLGSGTYPCYAGYDPVNHYVYVANLGSDNVTVLDGAQVIANIATGASPCFVAVSPRTGLVYVPNSAASNVSILNGTTFVGNVSDGVGGREATYDPANGYVYVYNLVSNTITVINGTHDLGNFTAGGSPRAGVVDAANGYLYVINWGNETTSVFNGSRTVATVNVQGSPFSILYDPASQDLYVPDYSFNNVSILGKLNSPYGVTFQETGLPSGTGWNISLANTTLPSNSTTIVFDAVNGTFGYLVPTVPGYYATPQGNVTVAGDHPTVNISFSPTFPVEFKETGLASNTSWSVRIGSTTNTTGTAVNTLDEPNGTFDYRILGVPGYVTTWTGNVTVSGTRVDVAVTFSVKEYTVQFNETGLPASTAWQVWLAGSFHSSTTATLPIGEPNGTYNYSVAPMAGYEIIPQTGNFTVFGGDLYFDVTFLATFPVVFDESGLPAGTLWGVQLFHGSQGTTTGSTVPFDLPAGSYSYRILSVPGYMTNWTGTFRVSAPGPLAIPVAFVPYVSPVVFYETGLPAGTSWSVTVNGTARNSSANAITYLLANGTYDYSVATIPGYRPIPSETIHVTGLQTQTSVYLTFLAIHVPKYAITFLETGLTPGTAWSIHVGGVYLNSTQPSAALTEPNGSYPYTIAPLPGYGTNWSGTATVAGAPVTVNVTFRTFTYAVTFELLGLPAGTTWNVSLGGPSYPASAGQLQLLEPNGSYTYVLALSTGSVNGSGSGTFHVGGHPVRLTFSYVPPTTPAGPSGLSTPEELGIAAAVIAVGVIAALLIVRRRRGGAAAASTEEAPPSDDPTGEANPYPDGGWPEGVPEGGSEEPWAENPESPPPGNPEMETPEEYGGPAPEDEPLAG